MFKSKLTNTFKSISAWSELADSLQRLNDATIEPTLERLKGMTNVFTMHPDDLQVRFNELGAFFSIGLTDQEDVPLLLQQRTDEIHYKGYEYPLTKTFEREFLGVPMSWQQLYAPKDLITHPYGSRFLLLNDIINSGLDRNDYFQTKRAVIFSKLNHVNGKFKNINEFEQLIERVVVPLIPTHIAFDGQQYYLGTTFIDDRPQAISLPKIEIRQSTSISDKRQRNEKLIIKSVTFKDGILKKSFLTGSKPTTSNMILFDDYPLDMIPIDMNFQQGNK